MYINYTRGRHGKKLHGSVLQCGHVVYVVEVLVINSIHCTSCQKWVHRKCGIKGSIYKVMKTLVCRGCMNPVTGVIAIWDSGYVLLFRWHVECWWRCWGRIRIGWNKFRQLVLLLTSKDISLIVTGRLYSSCVWSSMLHGSETLQW